MTEGLDPAPSARVQTLHVPNTFPPAVPAILCPSTRYFRPFPLLLPLLSFFNSSTPSSFFRSFFTFVVIFRPSSLFFHPRSISPPPPAGLSSLQLGTIPMPSAVALRPPDRTDWTHWMNLQCNGRCRPATALLDDRNMHTCRAALKIDTERRFSHHTAVDSSNEGPSPAKLRRRASQGSLRTKPSPVSRFLSKSSVAVHFPSWDQRSSSPVSPSRNRSADSRLRLSTTVSRGPRPLTARSRSPSASSAPWNSPPSSFQSDYPATLPPTPPEDDSHIAWNPQSEMLLFDDQPHREAGSSAMMDEGPGIDTSSTGRSDTLSSPSDGSTHASSSSGGSPGPRDEMDLQQDVGSWLDHGINVTGKQTPISVFNGFFPGQ